MEATPVLQQLGLMECSPLHYKRQGAWGKGAAKEPNRMDPDLGLGSGVGRMKMRWLVVKEIHPDYDAEEPGRSQAWAKSNAVIPDGA